MATLLKRLYLTVVLDRRNEWALAAFDKYIATPHQLHAIKTIRLGDLHIHILQLVKSLLSARVLLVGIDRSALGAADARLLVKIGRPFAHMSYL